jgi:PEP-CTERM motif
MRGPVRILIAAATLGSAVLAPIPASAAPITLYFDVSVDTRFSYVTQQATAIDPVTFLLAMTFDGQGTPGPSSQDATIFGAPTFLGLPDALAVPTAAIEAPPLTGGSEAAGNGSSQTYVQNWHNFLLAASTQKWSSYGADSSALREITLRSDTRVSDFDTPDLDLFLSRMTADVRFYYGGYALSDGVYSPDSFQYSGTATQVPAPVPEPGTLTLLGAGLAVGARRVRRRSIDAGS